MNQGAIDHINFGLFALSVANCLECSRHVGKMFSGWSSSAISEYKYCVLAWLLETVHLFLWVEVPLQNEVQVRRCCMTS